VTVLGATSFAKPVLSGVPQGSILCPILFLLYVNNLPDVVNNAKIVSFADGTKVFKCVDSHIYGASIQSDLDNREEWRLLLDLYLIKLNASVRELP
jgi:sarcosine oxidase/L-pipecolate oxidase